MVMKSRFFMRAFRSMLVLMVMLAGNGFCETAPAGFVGLEKDDAGVWWFKSPDGKPFLSIGMNHVEPEYWQSPNNKAFVLETYGPDLFAADGTFQDGSPAADQWAQHVAVAFKTWGFNTLGVHNPLLKSLRATDSAYYVVELGQPYNWGWNFQRSALVRAFKKKQIDVFGDRFISEVRSRAAELVKPRANDPLVLGYTYTDGPPWIIEDGQSSEAFQKLSTAEKIIHPWVLSLISSPAEAKGKQAWVALMKERYASPEEAGATYACDIKAWDEMAVKTGWASISDKAKAADDSRAFLEQIMRQWYEVRREAIRQYDRNHLILGDKLNMNRDSNHPEQLAPNLRIMSDYVDVIQIQYYAPFAKQRSTLALIYRESGKPVFNGDTNFPMGQDVPLDNTEHYSQLGQTYADELTKLFSLPYFIGWHHCGYIRGLRLPYVAALRTGNQQTIAIHEKNKDTYRQGFFTESEEPIKPILTPLSQAISNCVGLHRASGALEKTK